jgi:hypothetical protein
VRALRSISSFQKIGIGKFSDVYVDVIVRNLWRFAARHAFDAGINGDRQDLSTGTRLTAIGRTYCDRNYCDCDGRKP